MVKDEQLHLPATVTSQVEEPIPSPSAIAINRKVSKDAPKRMKIEIVKPKKKGPGRPPRIEARVITPKPIRHGRVTKVDDHVYVRREDSEDDQKYRRMRDLNNEASKRCRQNRKNKFIAVEIEMEYLEEKNKELKFKVRKMEEIVSTLKKKFISDIANPKQKAKREIVAADLFPVPQNMGLVQTTNTSQEVFVAPTPPQALNTEQTYFPDLLDMEWGGIM